MRVEEYERDLKGSYKIVGFSGGMVDFLPRHSQPLEMKVFYDGKEIISDADWERYVFPHIDSYMFHNRKEYDNQSDFIHNCSDIMMGKYGDWKLDVVEVTPVSAILEYRIPSSYHNYGFLWLTLPDTMRLEIKGPAISDEMRPTYAIGFYPDSKVSHIIEDMGHTVRDIRLCIKDSSRPIKSVYIKEPYSDNPYTDNQYAKITEYVYI